MQRADDMLLPVLALAGAYYRFVDGARARLLVGLLVGTLVGTLVGLRVEFRMDLRLLD